MSPVDDLFEKLWDDYTSITPSAVKIHDLLKEGQNKIINDHVAFRTFDHPKLNKASLARHFMDLGYKESGTYRFEDKKLNANHYEHSDPLAPKIFISELSVSECSESLQKIVAELIAQAPDDISLASSFLHSGAPWNINYADYQTLLSESEYAAWMSAWGYHANHFTVSVNQLSNFTKLEDVNAAVKKAGFTLNSSGGEIKGTPAVLLEQSSTMADEMAVSFTDRTIKIPSCFYEFALRHPKPDGQLYSGFVAANADKIFDSTNVN